LDGGAVETTAEGEADVNKVGVAEPIPVE